MKPSSDEPRVKPPVYSLTMEPWSFSKGISSDCVLEQVIGSRKDGLILKRTCDGEQFWVARVYDGPGQVGFHFVGEASDSQYGELIFVDGVAEEQEQGQPANLPSFTYGGQKYVTKAEVWRVDREKLKATTPRGRVISVTIAGDQETQGSNAEPNLWGVYSSACAGGEECVYVGRAMDVCRASFAKVDLSRGYTPSAPIEWGVPPGCVD